MATPSIYSAFIRQHSRRFFCHLGINIFQPPKITDANFLFCGELRTAALVQKHTHPCTSVFERTFAGITPTLCIPTNPPITYQQSLNLWEPSKMSSLLKSVLALLVECRFWWYAAHTHTHTHFIRFFFFWPGMQMNLAQLWRFLYHPH